MPDLRIRGARGAKVRFRFDGREVEAFAGESIAAALLANGIHSGLFCAMGLCQACAVLVDGRRVEACRHRVAEGLEVRRVE